MGALGDAAEYRRIIRERAQQRVRLQSVTSVQGALRSSLRTGLIGTDERLDESALITRFSVSRNAVRAALGLLVDEGLVSRSPRAGTVVRSGITDVHIDDGVGCSAGRAEPYRCEVTEDTRVPATPLTRRYLDDDGPWAHLTELVLIRPAGPSMLHTRFTPDGAAPRRLVTSSVRPKLQAEFEAEFEAEFARAYGSPLDAVDCWIEAVQADERTAARLHVTAGTALLVKSRVLLSADGRPREYSITRYLASRTALSKVTHGPTHEAPVRRCRDRRPAPAPAPGAPLRTGTQSVHTELRAAVREALLPMHTRLDEQELAGRFGVSRNCMRRGLSDLAAEGVVSRSRNAGTVVRAAITDITLDNGTGWDPAETGRFRAEQLALATVPTPPYLARMLQTDELTLTVSEHVGHRDGHPFALYLRYTRPDVPDRPLSCDSDLDFEELFARAHGSPVRRIETTVHAVRAHARTAPLLRVAPAALLLLKERLLIDEDGVPREFSHSYYAAATVALSTRTRVRSVRPLVPAQRGPHGR